MPDRPNILFVLTDQQRGDCVGADPACRTVGGEPAVRTPHVDELVADGTLFSRAYTPAPSSMPARRCLITGQTPATNGCPGWVTGDWEFEHTLPGLLTRGGYQSHVIGKFDAIPRGNRCGFEGVEYHFTLGENREHLDYDEWLAERTDGADWVSDGVGLNSWVARPWHLDERLHPTTWTTDRAVDFIRKRDPTRPFFLQVAYYHPHRPLTPPEHYYEAYQRRELPEPYVGDWAADIYGEHVPEYPTTGAWCADLDDGVLRDARAGYYGLITHIDHQFNRIVTELADRGEWENTLVVFTSDHGEMLGDHYLGRKTYAYEGSARVPLVAKYPAGMAAERGRVVDRPVGLEDLLPTFLDAADLAVPETVEGRSLLDLAADPDADWREYYHGEHAPIYHDENACQYLVGERFKYIWNPVTGDELLFDLAEDPGELHDRSADPEHADTRERFRRRLVSTLADRPEGFVADGDLVACPRASPIPHPVDGD